MTLCLSLDSCRGSSRSGWSAAVGHSLAAQRSAGGAVEMCGLSPRHQVTSSTPQNVHLARDGGLASSPSGVFGFPKCEIEFDFPWHEAIIGAKIMIVMF